MGAINASQDWKDEFRQIQTEELDTRKRIVQHSFLPDKFQLLTVLITDEQERAVMHSRLEKRHNIKPKNLSRLQKIYYKEEQGYCGTQAKYELIYEFTPTRLVDHFNYRKNNEGFNFEEVLYVIYRVCLGLKDVQQLQDSHGRVDMQTVVVGKQVKLQDPLSVQIKYNDENDGKRSKRTSYPSPNRLLNRVDSGMNLDSFRQDLFSLGVLALQLCYPKQRVQQIYKSRSKSYQNQLIDFNILYRFVLKIEHPLLRECIKILVSQFPYERIKVFYCLQNYRVNNENINLFQISPKFLSPAQQLAQQLRPQNQFYYSKADSKYPRPQLSYSNILGVKAIQSDHVVQYTHKNSSTTQPSEGNTKIYPVATRQILFQSQVVPHNGSIPINKIKFNSNLPEKVSIFPQNPSSNQVKLQNVNNDKILLINSQNISMKKLVQVPIIPVNHPFIQNSNGNSKILNEGVNKIRQIQFGPIQNTRMSQSKQKVKTVQFNYDKVIEQLPQQKYKTQNIEPEEVSHQQKQKKVLNQQNQQLQQRQNKQLSDLYQKISAMTISSDKPEKYNQYYKNVNYKPQITGQPKAKPVKSKPLKQVLIGLEQQMSQLQKLTKQNELLQKQINEGAFSLFQKLTIPMAEQSILQVSGQDSQEQQAPQTQFIIEEYQSGNRYEGFMKNKMRNGYGKFYYNNGSIYDGQWIDNKMNGYGILFYGDGSIAYQGEWRDDYFHGRGMIYNDIVSEIGGKYDYSDFRALQNDEWLSYEGEIVKDKKHGVGKLVLSNGQMYEGQFYEDKVHGEGVFTQKNGNKIKGVWSDGFLKTLIY